MRCPECDSEEISLPSHSEPFCTCADCGHSWGELYELLRKERDVEPITRTMQLTIEVEVTAPADEDAERCLWTAEVSLSPTVRGVKFGTPAKVGVECEE